MFQYKGSVFNTAKMAGEWNAPTRGAVQNKSASFLRIFSWSQWLEIVRNVSFYTQPEDGYEFRRCFWIKQCWTPASWSRFVAVSIWWKRVVSLDKSILYLQILCKTSNSTFVLVVHDYVWDRFCCQCTEVNNFLTGPTPQVTNRELFGRQMRLL